MSKLRVMQTPVRFSPAIGGVEKYVLELGKDLVAYGDEVTVVSADEPHAKTPSKINGIKSIRLPFKAKVANTNITPALFKTLKSEDFDVIHTHIPTPWSADISALVSLIKRRPLIVTYHNDLVGDGLGGVIAKCYNATLLHFVLWRAKKIIITQEKYLEYSQYLKRHKRKVEVVPLGVNEPKTFKVKRDADQLCFMSVLDKYHEYKGLDVLLEALADVRKDFPKAHLVVGGKGELIEKYKAQAKELGVANAVKFLGYVSDDDRDRMYAESGAFVLPSINSLEGFGIVALEALTYGTPVVTTSLAGSSAHIKAHDAGIVVPPKDVKALSGALRELFNDPQNAAKMGENGRAFAAKEFSWKAIAEKMHYIYEAAGARPHGKSSDEKTRRIIQVSAYYVPHVGGQEWAVKDLATNLAEGGNDVTVITSGQGAAAGIAHEQNDVEVVRLKSSEFAHTAIMPSLLLALIKRASKDDVVHVHIGQAFTPEVVWLASKIKRFKYVAQMHIEPTASGPVGSILAVYKKTFLKRALRGASAIIVLNKEHQGIIKEKYGYRGKIVVMNNGMNEEYFTLKRSPKNGKTLSLFTIARFSPQKNLPMLVESLKWTKHKVHLDIAGDGEERPKIEAAIREFKLEKHVTLHGMIERSENLKFYATCDAFILASLYEAQPLTLLEAMASRVPIIGTNVQGVGEHIKGMGYVVEPTPASIAAGIDALVEDKTRGKKFTEAAFKKAQAFRWSTLLQQYEKLYDEVRR